MKNFSLLVYCFFILACSDSRSNLPKTGNFGETINEGITPVELNSISFEDSIYEVETIIRGTISKVCQGEGCWLNLNYRDSMQIRVNAKDKKFILPKGIEGKHAVAKGSFIQSIESGKIRFEATGIRIE